MAMLGGSLDVFVLPDVLRLVSRASASGRLVVRRTGADGALGFRDGDVVGGELDSQEVEDEDGLLDAVLMLMDASGGEFSLEPEPVKEVVRLGVDDLLAGVSERRAQWNAILAEVGGLDQPVRLVARLPESAKQVTLDPMEWQIAVLADGRRTVGEVSRALGTSTFKTAAILLEMSRSGLLEVDVEVDEEPPGRARPAAARRAQPPRPVKPPSFEDEPEGDEDPVELLHEISTPEPTPSPRSRARPLTREEQRLNLRR
jgi:hypothetical protein